MRRLLFAAVIAAVGWIGAAPAMATSLGLPGPNGSNINATRVEKVGYWRRMYRRYGYPGPYAYYPPVYGNQAPPPPADGNYPSAEGDYGNYPPSEGGDYGDYPANGS